MLLWLTRKQNVLINGSVLDRRRFQDNHHGEIVSLHRPAESPCLESTSE